MAVRISIIAFFQTLSQAVMKANKSPIVSRPRTTIAGIQTTRFIRRFLQWGSNAPFLGRCNAYAIAAMKPQRPATLDVAIFELKRSRRIELQSARFAPRSLAFSHEPLEIKTLRARAPCRRVLATPWPAAAQEAVTGCSQFHKGCRAAATSRGRRAFVKSKAVRA